MSALLVSHCNLENPVKYREAFLCQKALVVIQSGKVFWKWKGITILQDCSCQSVRELKEKSSSECINYLFRQLYQYIVSYVQIFVFCFCYCKDK